MKMKKIRIGIDIDGVIRDFIGRVLDTLNEHYPDNYNGAIPLQWDFSDVLTDMTLSDLIYGPRGEDIFLYADPINISGLKYLCGWTKEMEYELVCCSYQTGPTILATDKWLQTHNLKKYFVDIIYTKDKWKVDIDYLVDDAPYNYEAWVENERAENKFILMNDSYRNQNVNATNKINTLFDVPQIINNVENIKGVIDVGTILKNA